MSGPGLKSLGLTPCHNACQAGAWRNIPVADLARVPARSLEVSAWLRSPGSARLGCRASAGYLFVPFWFDSITGSLLPRCRLSLA